MSNGPKTLSDLKEFIALTDNELAGTDLTPNLDQCLYQELAVTTAIYPDGQAITYPLLGLIGEVGEFANKWKKVIRDGTPFDREDMEAELGDILWYIANLANDAGLCLADIGYKNLVKLSDRATRNVIGGSGDKR